jgi:hypothetical protein
MAPLQFKVASMVVGGPVRGRAYHFVCLRCKAGWLTRQCQTTAWKAAGIKGAMSQAIRRGPHSARWRASSQSSPQCAREPCLRVPPARLLIRRPMSGSPQRAHRGFRVGPPGLAARDLLGALRFTGYVLTFDIGILGHAIARVARRIILHSAAPLGTDRP